MVDILSDLEVLKTVNSNFQLDIIKGLLEENNIAYIIKDHGTGGYMRIIGGNSMPFRTDILVAKESYEMAKEIIAPFNG